MASVSALHYYTQQMGSSHNDITYQCEKLYKMLEPLQKVQVELEKAAAESSRQEAQNLVKIKKMEGDLTKFAKEQQLLQNTYESLKKKYNKLAEDNAKVMKELKELQVDELNLSQCMDKLEEKEVEREREGEERKKDDEEVKEAVEEGSGKVSEICNGKADKDNIKKGCKKDVKLEKRGLESEGQAGSPKKSKK